MDIRKMKAAADWFRSKIFTDEAIQPRAPVNRERVPAMIRTARSLASGSGQGWQARESVFLKQGKLLASYEEDYEFNGTVRSYYPTYQSLTDEALRGYFSWRTKLRGGTVSKTFPAFAFLYVYELLNQIGVADPMDGYRKLKDFQEVYSQLDPVAFPYIRRWLPDYVVYYGLDPALLAQEKQVIFDRNVSVLEHMEERTPEEIAKAVRQLAPHWLERSKFRKQYSDDMDAVLVRVLRRMSKHYASRCKKTMIQQFFGVCVTERIQLFEAAVFCDPLKRENYEYVLDEQCVYCCENGLWSVYKRSWSGQSKTKLESLTKTVDSVMRQEYGYRSPVRPELDAKWILRIIQEEVRAFLAERTASEEKAFSIDYAQLARIRRDAASTQEKLIVEEEVLEEMPPGPVPAAEQLPPAETAGSEDAPLSPAEYRLLQCLLYGGGLEWVQAEGRLLSVLVDSVNEKLYDRFQDAVLEDGPRPVEDYIEDLKEMVRL